MKSNLKTLNLVLAFLIIGNNQSLAQKNAWHLFQPNSSFKNVQFNGTNSAPNLGTSFNQLRDQNGNPFTNYLATNVMTDEDGKLLFTVISTFNGLYLYDINNQLVGGQPLTSEQGSKEIAIVPIDKGVRYHILAAGSIWEYDLANFSVNHVKTLGTVILKHGSNTSFKDFNVAVKLNFENNNPENCLISYTCYWLQANPNGITSRAFGKLDYVLKNNSDRGQFEGENIRSITAETSGFNSYLSEMDISPDGSKVAFADDHDVFVVELSNFYIRKFNYDNGIVTRKVAGLEFTIDNKLVFSLFDVGVSGGSLYDKIYLWDFSNSSTNNYSEFNSSSNFSRSAIETGKDGKIYVASSSGLYQLNVGALSISSMVVSTNIYKNMDIFMHLFPNTTPPLNFGIFNLPDQIDGLKQEFLKLSEVAYSIRNGKINWQKTVFMPSNGINWSNTSHGLTSKGSGKVLVLGKLEFLSLFYTTKTVVLKEMDIRFNDDAECNVYQNVTLNLVGTSLRGMDCGLMWHGVSLRSSSKGSASTKATLKLDSSPTLKDCWITDAYNGIKTLGNWGTIIINPFAVFSANERDLSLYGIKRENLSVNGAIFYGSVPLRNQKYGFHNYEDFDDNLNRTVTHIQLVKSDVIIGSLTGLTNINLMFDAQYGVHAIESSVELYNADISKTKMYGCWFNANLKENKYVILVRECKFHELRQGMRIENKVKVTTIQSNKFVSTDAYAIEYKDNPGGKLLIGDEDEKKLGNLFSSCNLSAIHCWGNSVANNVINSSNSIEIYNNEIVNQINATGISVCEPASVDLSYKLFVIENNLIGSETNRIGKGIVLKHISGGNQPKSMRYNEKYLFNEKFRINSNKLNFYSLSPYQNNIAIWSENSNGLNFLENVINSGRFGDDWRNIGIFCSEGKSNLIHKNEINAGKGLLVTGNGIFSNYYCNQFNYCVNGIQLGYNVLRDKANKFTHHDDNKIHAHIDSDLKIYGRTNYFNNQIEWGSNMDFLTDNNLTHAQFNQWDFESDIYLPTITPFTKVSSTSNNTIGDEIVHNRQRYNPCVRTPQLPSTYNNQVNIDYSNINDPILVWKLMYSINRFNKQGYTSQFVDDISIKTIQNIEDKIHEQDYQGAKFVLDNFNPINTFDFAFKTVYDIWVMNRLQLDTVWINETELETDTFYLDSINYFVESGFKDTSIFFLQYKPLTESEVHILSEIANLDATLNNPAAYPARAILWGEKHLEFNDAPIPFYPNITGYVKAPCEGGGNSGVVIKMYDSDGVLTEIETVTQEDGFFLIEGTRLQSLNPDKQYYVSAMLPNSVVNSQIAPYNQLALQSYHILDCTLPLGKRNGKVLEIAVYPNPTTKLFNFTNMPLNWKMQVNNILGVACLSKEGSGNTSINAVELPKGIYIATIIDTITNEKTTKKLLVQ